MEHVKLAIEKARAAREALPNNTDNISGPIIPDPVRTAPPPDGVPTPPSTAEVPTPGAGASGVSELKPDQSEQDIVANWNLLEKDEIDGRRMKRKRIITYNKTDPAHVAFDTMRTQLRPLMAENGWTRIGVTSPLPGCGKSVVSTNLAFSMSRHGSNRTLLFDTDLKSPSIGSYFGKIGRRPVRDLLNGSVSYKRHMIRYGDGLAVAFNSERVFDGAELVEDANTARVLDEIHNDLRPDVSIFDLAPLLSTDDPFAMLSHLDCVILVIGAGKTQPDEVLECERLINGRTNYLGVLLNKVNSLPKKRESYY